MDGKFKFALSLLGIGIIVGVVIAWVLFKVLGAEPSEVGVGPIKFQLPTTETSVVENPTNTVSPSQPTQTPRAISTATSTPVSPPSPTSTPVPLPIPTPVPLTTGIKTADIDQIFGAGNWFCFDGFPNGIGVKKVPPNLVVGNPLFAVDTPSGRYTIGQTVPAGGHATGWLQDNLLNSECTAQVDRSPLTGSELDQILGGNNWYCLSGLPNGFTVIDMPANFVVQSPIIAVDKQEGKFGKGETVPGGGMATVWFFRDLPGNQCP